MQKLEDYNDFVFEQDQHRYVDATGVVRRSITQRMGDVGIYDFSMVRPEVLENARRRGTNTHRWCAEFDLFGYCDPSWMAEDERPYYDAWVKFRKESGLVIKEVELPMLRRINGVLVGGTPDVVGWLGPVPYIVERKACASKHPGWAIQVALQEMLITGRPRVGHYGRMSVQLKPNGTYRTHYYDDPSDAHVALAIVNLTENPLDVESEIAINNWKFNAGLKKAA